MRWNGDPGMAAILVTGWNGSSATVSAAGASIGGRRSKGVYGDRLIGERAWEARCRDVLLKKKDLDLSGAGRQGAGVGQVIRRARGRMAGRPPRHGDLSGRGQRGEAGN